MCNEISLKNPDLKLDLKKSYEKVQEAYNNPSTILKSKSNIRDLKKSDIDDWSYIVKTDKAFANRVPGCSICSIYEKIAILMRAFKIFKKYEPRDIQIISLLLLLNPDDGKGRLAQINTGLIFFCKSNYQFFLL